MSATDNPNGGNLFDPVSGRSVSAGPMPISCVYNGRAYYFESRENRDAFERNPAQYIAGSAPSGQSIGADEPHPEHRHRRRGC